jgi:hypothetical protein
MLPTLPIAAEEWTAPSARNFDVPMGGVVMRGGGVTVGGGSSTGSSVMAASRKKSLYVKLEKMDSMPVSSEGSSTGADCTLGGTWPIREAPACCSSGNMADAPQFCSAARAYGAYILVVFGKFLLTKFRLNRGRTFRERPVSLCGCRYRTAIN